MILRGLLALFLLVGSPAFAASYQHSVLQVAISSGTTFTGPGDIVSGATAWYGLRGYSAAVAATGTQKAINVRRQSDNATSDIVILTNGNLDVATAASFAGTDATCTGTIASTTLTCASASSTPNANDPVSGTGITQPAYIVSCGTFTAGAGTCTLNAAQTVSVAETITMQVALFVTKWYDQSGALNCSAAPCDITQTTAANQPQLLLKCLGSNPCVYGAGSSWLIYGLTSTSQPLTVSTVAERTGNFTAQNFIFSGGDGTMFGPAANQVSQFYNIFPNAVVSDSVPHALAFIGNGASSNIYVDGVSNVGSAGSGAFPATPSAGVLARGDGNSAMTGYIFEVGLWPSAFTTPQATNSCNNQFVYYGTPTC